MNMFERSLVRALYSLLKPVFLLFPFRSLPEHLCRVVLPLVLIGSYTSFPPTDLNNPWAHWFYCLLSFLSLTRQQFDHLVNIPQVIQPPQRLSTELFYFTRPKVFLRVLIPRTGFSVVVSALIDTGASWTVMSAELARLLLANGAKIRYTWPQFMNTFSDMKTVNRMLDGGDLLLQSIEDETMTFQPMPILIEEWTAFHYSETDMLKVANMLKTRGVLSAVAEKWETVMTSKKDINWTRDSLSDCRNDLTIGQDLLDHFVFVRPRQPTYHITDSLTMIRTKLGLVLSGCLDYKKLDGWKVTPEEAKRIEGILYPENADKPEPLSEMKELSTLLPQTQVQIKKILTENLSSYPMTCVDYYHCLLSLILYLHLIVLLLLSFLTAFLFQSIFTISFSRHIPFLQKAFIRGHSIYLVFLFNIADNIRWLYSSLLTSLLEFLGCTFPTQLMDFFIGAYLPLTVSNKKGKKQHSKTVNAFIDSGSTNSFISSRLVKKLKVKTEKFKRYEMAKVTVSSPNLKDTHMNNTSFVYKFIPLKDMPFDQSYDEYEIFSPKLLRRLSHLLSIPLCHLSTLPQYCNELLIGADLLPYLLPQTHSPRVISLLPNLSAHETRFGYYLQGQQKSAHLTDFHNWELLDFHRFDQWWWLVVCLSADALLGLLVYLNNCSLL